EPDLVPALQQSRFEFRQPGSHRKFGLRQEKRLAPIALRRGGRLCRLGGTRSGRDFRVFRHQVIFLVKSAGVLATAMGVSKVSATPVSILKAARRRRAIPFPSATRKDRFEPPSPAPILPAPLRYRDSSVQPVLPPSGTCDRRE